MDDETEYLKLPIEERCQHKSWKARVNGYEAATKLFQQITDEKSPEWSKYLGLVKKFVVDSNAVAQEKGLEAVLAYVENAGCAGKTCGEVVSGIVAKCLGAPKAKTKEKGIEIILMYVEIERHEIVQDELIKGLTNKSPKVVVACVQALRESLREFGSKVVAVKPLVKQIPALLEDRDKNVRDEGKMLTVEVFRWIGAAFKPQLASLKPVQVSELEVEFEKVSSEKAVPTRYLRSQQALRDRMAQKANTEGGGEDNGDEDDVEEEAAPEIDPYELMQPVDILSKLPKDFYEKCEAKKWQDRKEAVDLLLPLATTPKLENGDYGDLVRVLRKIIAKDSNVMVIAVAGKCLAGLANGLKKRFQQFVGQCASVILEKFKEKKQNVVQAMREAIDAMYHCTTLDALQDDIIEYLDNKNPSVKMETVAFVTRVFKHCDAVILGKKQLKVYCPALVKTLNDNDPLVRDNAAEALGTAMKVVGEKTILLFIGEVENIKLTKIKECCEKCELIGPRQGSKTKKAAGASKVAPTAVSKPASSAPVRPPGPARPAAKTATSALGKKVTGAKPGAKLKKAASAGSGGKSEEVLERELSVDEVEEKASAILPAEVLTGLADANWKTRLSAMQLFIETVRSMDRSEIPSQVLIRTLVKKPGLKENNFQVLKLKLELITHLASNSDFSRRSTQYVVDDLAEKIGDAKNGSGVAEALTAMAEATRLDHLGTQVLDLVFAQKSPKNQSEAMNWLATAVKEFGLVVQVKPVIDNVKKALSATNPAVRTSAITLLGVIYLYMGPSLRMLFENEKAALLQQIDAEFEKLQGLTPPAPTRGLVRVTSSASDDGSGEGGGTTAEVPNVADLIPRTDISVHLTGSLIDEMGDKNWKIRLEALQKLATIVNEAKFIMPNLGDLPTALKARMSDANKNLAIQAINICQAIGTGMGPNCKQHARNLGPGMICGLGDGKNTVRAVAMSCMNAWVEQCGLLPFMEGELMSDSLKPENPNLRIELFGFLTEHLPNAKSVPSSELSLCLPYLFAALEDRNVEVRKKAQEAVLPFMIHLGYESMSRAASKLKPVSKTQVMSYLDKSKPNLPAKPAPVNKAIRGGGTRPVTAKISAPSSNVANDDSSNSAGEVGEGCSSPSMKGGSKMKVANRAASKTRLVSAAKVGVGSKKGSEDVDTSPPMIANNLKEQRIQDEQRLKVLKWNFTAPRDEFYELLKEQMTAAGFNRTLVTQLFHSDFKFHIKSLETFQECLENFPEASIANLDLTLKWLALRFFDTNPSVIIKGLEYLQSLFSLLAENVYHFSEYEAASFIPYLILKVGDPKDPVRQAVRTIFKLIYKVYPSNKMFLYLMDGLKSKNARQRMECLDELGCLIEMYGMSVCQPNPSIALKEVARQISDRDNGVRNAALNCIVQAYFLDGERVYKHIGAISDKDISLLEERIKRASKNRSSQPVLIPQPQQQQQQQPMKVPSPESKTKMLPPRPASHMVTEEQVAVVRRMVAARPPVNRPISGAFSLDLEKLEHMMEEREEVTMPKLVKPDLDDLREPIRFPETKMRPPSPATKILNSSHDAASALDLVISQIASNDVTVSVQALAQIDEFLKEEERAESMITRVDQLLVASSLQFRMIYTKHMSDESTNKTDVVRLYRCLTMTVVTLFQHRMLARKASKDVLRDLVYNLVTILLDCRLNELKDGANVIRAINVLVVKVVERSDHTNMMSALIKLLHDCVANDNSSAKFTELIMKCIWKMVRLMADIVQDLNLDKILLDLHQFLKAFPLSHWKGKSNDMPLRTVKTVLHTLAKQKGNKIMSHLTLIDNLQDSEIEAYLQKVLKGGVRHRTSTNEEFTDQTSNRRENRHSPRRLSKTTHEMLAEIFKKIGSKETTREGLVDLYNFKLRHPEANIKPFLSKSSQFFQNYIERGLHNIEQERDSGKFSSSHSPSSLLKQNQLSNSTGNIPASSVPSLGSDGSQSVDDADAPPSFYLERLKLLRAQCGLDNSEYDRSSRTTAVTGSRGTLSKAVSMSGSLEYSQSTGEMTTTMICRDEKTVVSHITHSSSSEGISSLSAATMGSGGGGGGGAVEDLKRRLELIKMGTKM